MSRLTNFVHVEPPASGFPLAGNLSFPVQTSILKVLLKQYMSPTGPNKYLRSITPIKTDQLELHLFKVKISKDCIEKSGKLN